MDITAVINQKGGVGKTTTTANLGVALAELGRSVLLIDLDPQANLGTHLGVDTEQGLTVYDILVRGVSVAEALRETGETRVCCVPSNLDLSGAEMELVSVVGRESILRDALEQLEREAPGRFDTVLLDCPPSLGVLTINALTAASRVLVPLQAEFFALQGMAKLTEIVGLVQRRLNPALKLGGIVACKVDRRTRLSQEVMAEVRRYFADTLMKTKIRPNVKLAEAPSFGKSVLAYAPDSNGAADYRQLAREWLGMPVEGEDDDEDVVVAEELSSPHGIEDTAHESEMAPADEAPADAVAPAAEAVDPAPEAVHLASTVEAAEAADAAPPSAHVAAEAPAAELQPTPPTMETPCDPDPPSPSTHAVRTPRPDSSPPVFPREAPGAMGSPPRRGGSRAPFPLPPAAVISGPGVDFGSPGYGPFHRPAGAAAPSGRPVAHPGLGEAATWA